MKKIFLFLPVILFFTSGINADEFEQKFMANGRFPYDGLGRSVASGDVDGDGLDDMICGAYHYTPHGGAATPGNGEVQVYFGSSLTNYLKAGITNAAPDVVLTPGGAIDDFQFGRSVAVGDINGDGLDEILVGAPGEFSSTGSVHIFLGNTNHIYSGYHPVLKGADIVLFGTAITVPGDMSGDGINDFAIGAPGGGGGTNFGIGEVIIYNGETSSVWTVPSMIVSFSQTGLFAGSALAEAGDINNDNVPDLLIGTKADISLGDSHGLTYSAEAYVLFGKIGGTGVWDNTIDKTYVGESALDDFGISLDGIDDINNDGFDDVLIGAGRYFRTNNTIGRAYIFYGNAASPSLQYATNADVTLYGVAPRDGFGFYTANIDDINGDTNIDFAISAPAYSNAAGCVCVYFGGTNIITGVSADQIIYHNQLESNFGESSCSLKLNDNKLVIGSYRNTPDVTLSNAGSAFIYTFIPTRTYATLCYRISCDGGTSWSNAKYVDINPTTPGRWYQAVDPTAVVLPDGRIRLWYFGFFEGMTRTGAYEFLVADSTDAAGTSFVEYASAALTSPTSMTDPMVLFDDETNAYRMYIAAPPGIYISYATDSGDTGGLGFSPAPTNSSTLVVDPASVPGALIISNMTYLFAGLSGNIVRYESTNGVDFYNETVVISNMFGYDYVNDPAPWKLLDNSYIMAYKARPNGVTYPAYEEIYLATSTNGLDWIPQVYNPGLGSVPTVLQRSDGALIEYHVGYEEVPEPFYLSFIIFQLLFIKLRWK